jgi:hypothetical protein
VAEDGRGQQEPADRFLSTHPSGKDRIEEMNANMHLVLPVFARAKGWIRTTCRHTVRSRCRSPDMPRHPLPMRDGVAPSYLYLPEGDWPDMISFLVARFPDVPRPRGASAWRAATWWMATAIR